MSTYDFYIAGRWRNKDNVASIVTLVRNTGHTAYCFIENDYKGEAVEFDMHSDPDTFMQQAEALGQDHPLVHKIFENDVAAEKAAANFLLVLPAGTASHIEAGIAYGMGKHCYAVGEVGKTETLYSIFEKIFPDEHALQTWLEEGKTT